MGTEQGKAERKSEKKLKKKMKELQQELLYGTPSSRDTLEEGEWQEGPTEEGRSSKKKNRKKRKHKGSDRDGREGSRDLDVAKQRLFGGSGAANLIVLSDDDPVEGGGGFPGEASRERLNKVGQGYTKTDKAKLRSRVASPDGDDAAAAAGEESKEMLRLLRLPRYFSAQEDQDKCFTCGEPGHQSAACPERVDRLRPCHVCGEVGHGERECPENFQNACFRCQQPGHMARDCPTKRGQGGAASRVSDAPRVPECMVCGASGHEFGSCWRGYDPDDLAQVECYVCGKKGHMSCADLRCEMPEETSCYSCGSSGHSGEACLVKNRGQGGNAGLHEASGSGSTCFRCGETGHFARECSKLSAPSSRRRSSSDSFRQNAGGLGSANGSEGCFKCGETGHFARECTSSSGRNARIIHLDEPYKDSSRNGRNARTDGRHLYIEADSDDGNERWLAEENGGMEPFGGGESRWGDREEVLEAFDGRDREGPKKKRRRKEKY